MKAITEDGYAINIPDSFNGYKFIKIIGTGSTSVVCVVESAYNGKLFSAKIIPKIYVQDKNLSNQINTEISVLKKVDHPNIVRFYDNFEFVNEYNETYIIIILEYCENGDLYEYTVNKNFESEYQKQEIIKGILKAVKYLHQKGIAHGDIKLENVLLDSNFTPKLSDFGFCKTQIIAGNESKSGTLYYAAPELLRSGIFNTLKTDIWAIGIMLYCLSEGTFPFPSGDQKLVIKYILSGKLNLNPGLNDNLRKVVKQCTKLRPEDRPSIEELIENELFDSYNKFDDFMAQENIDPFLFENDPLYYNYGFDTNDEYLALV